MNLNEFQQLLINFQQNNDDIVKQSTNFYQCALYENPSAIITLHFQNILSFASPNLVAMSLILLKRAFMSNDSKGQLNSDFMSSVSKDILSRLNKETISFISTTIPILFQNENLTPYIFSLLEDTSSFIATSLMQYHEMLDFIPILVKIVKSMSPKLSPPAINCIVQCNNYIPFINYELNEEQIIISPQDVYSIIQVSLTNSFSVDFTISALRMLFSFYEKMPKLIEFAPLISEIYSKIPKQQLIVALSDLCVFCDHYYIYFSQTLPILISSLLAIVTNNNGNDDNSLHIQTISIKIFLCLAKNFDVQFNPFLVGITTSIFVASCNFTDDSSDDIETNAPYSDDAIFILSEIYSTRTDYPRIVMQLSKLMIQRNEWNCRRSALSAIYHLLMSCETGLDAFVDDILSMIKDHFVDQHHICRYYAFNALSQLCTSYSLFLNQIVQSLIPIIISVFKAENSHQAKIAELKSIESICSNVSTESLLPVAQSLIEELLPQIQNPSASPMEQLMIIKCISKIALSTRISFDQFYPASMNWLKTAIAQTRPGEENIIRIQTIRTIPLIGKVVNLQIFLNDGVEFINGLLQINFSVIGENEKTSVLYALAEMSEILPHEIYVKFLQPIFTILGAILSIDYEIEEYPLSYDMASLTDRIAIPNRSRNVIIAYSRSQLQLNSNCIDVIIKLAETLKELTFPFVRPISKIVSKFVEFAYYSPLQSSSLRLFNSLINLYRISDPQLLLLFLPFVRNTLFSAVKNLFANSSSTLVDCFDLYANAMDGAQFYEEFVILVINVLRQLVVKRSLIIGKGANDNSPDLLSLDELEISIENFTNVLLNKFPQNMIGYSQKLLCSECHVFHILFMTDLFLIMMKTPNNLININQLLSLIFESINSSRMNLCYVAFVSLSKILQAIPIDQNLVTQSISKIVQNIQQNKEDENDSTQKVVDGALIALSAVFKIAYGKVDLSEIIPIWFNQMPVLLDNLDANIAFEVLCLFVKDKNSQILNNGSIAHLLHCCSEGIKKKRIADEIKSQIILITKALCANEELRNLVQEAISSLSIEDRKYIQSVI